MRKKVLLVATLMAFLTVIGGCQIIYPVRVVGLEPTLAPIRADGAQMEIPDYVAKTATEMAKKPDIATYTETSAPTFPSVNISPLTETPADISTPTEIPEPSPTNIPTTANISTATAISLESDWVLTQFAVQSLILEKYGIMDFVLETCEPYLVASDFWTYAGAYPIYAVPKEYQGASSLPRSLKDEEGFKCVSITQEGTSFASLSDDWSLVGYVYEDAIAKLQVYDGEFPDRFMGYNCWYRGEEDKETIRNFNREIWEKGIWGMTSEERSDGLVYLKSIPRWLSAILEEEGFQRLEYKGPLLN